MFHLLLLATFAITTARATYTLETQFLSYSNPEHRLANGGCCTESCGPCEVYFRICRRSHGTSVQSSGCPSGAAVSFTNPITEAENGSIIINPNGALYDNAFVFNPITYNGPTWTGSYQMFVSIQTSNNSKIDQVVFNWMLSPSLEWTPAQIGTTQNDVVTLEARARVFCGTNFYGPTCREFCIERDDSFGHYTCGPDGGIICREGYTDTTSNCVTPICAPDCNLDNGFCNVPGECICSNGWSGENCDECATPPECSAEHGFCTVPNECLCEEGYGGENCDEDLDVCGHQQPCAAGSTCTSTGPDLYVCTCPTGFTGANCDMETDECSPDPCQNRATCVDLFNDFQCQCVEGWTGETCNTNVDDCNPNPCLNGGSCSDEINGYSCSCFVGYFGTDCGESDCDSSPCSNGATCIPLSESYECVCDNGFTGSNCETDIDECLFSPCSNNATCMNTVGGYECVCPQGLEGSNCDRPISLPCDSSPCARGLECSNQADGGFICQFCEDGRCCEVDPDFEAAAAQGCPEATSDGNSEQNSSGVLIGVLVTLLLLLLIVAAAVGAAIGYYHFYRKRRSSSKEINPFNGTNLGHMNVTDNPTYLPADDLVPDDDSLEKANGYPSSAEPVYASTAVKYQSMAPIITNSEYDSLATSRDNLITPYSSYDKLSVSRDDSAHSLPAGNSTIANGHASTGARRAPPPRPPPPRPRKPQQGGNVVNPYASVDLGEIAEVSLHSSSASSSSRAEYDQLQKV